MTTFDPIRRRAVTGLALACTGLAAAAADTPPATPSGTASGAAPSGPVPLAEFFQRPSFYGAELSPDGRRVAMSIGSATHPAQLAVLDLETMTPTVVAAFDSLGVGRFRWVNDKRLVFDLATHREARREIRQAPGLFAVDADGENFRQLVQTTASWLKAPPAGREPLPWNVFLLDSVGRQDGPEVFVVSPKQFGGNTRVDYIELMRLNTLTGQAEPVEAPQHATQWLLDTRGELRMVVTRHENRVTVMARERGGNWRSMSEGDSIEGPAFMPLTIAPDGTFYVRSQGPGDKAALYSLDPASGKRSDAAVLVSKDFDLNPVAVATDQALLGWRLRVDAEVTQWIDPGMKALQAQLDRALPTTTNRISVARRAQTPYVLVEAFSDAQPSVHYLFHTGQKKLTKLGAAMPGIDPRRMGPMDLVRYPARDGLSIPAYLTLPANGARKNLPLVVLVHGGPWVRGGDWRWQPEVQFLASRGYAVLQPEFRGSTGFGSKHFKAGWRQWGQAMQNDLADGARWAIAQGIADPRRIAIAGASYGGYAAMMGLVNDPDLFRCAVNWVGVTDLMLMYTAYWSDIDDESKRYGLPRLLGDPKAEADKLRAHSPLHQAARIRQPVLMAYGGVDERVPIAHGERMRDALRAHNPSVEFIEYPSEGHGWARPETNIDFWGRVETFLGRHLAPR